MKLKAALVVAGIGALVVLAPTLADVYGEVDEAVGLDRRWLLIVVACEALVFACAWLLERIVLRTDRWFDVAAAQLSGNAVSHLVPAGGPAGAAVQLKMLSTAGFSLPRVTTSLAALSVLTSLGLLALPAVAFPATLLTGTVASRFEMTLLVGVGALAIVLAVAALFVARDEPLEAISRVVQRATSRLPRHHAREDLPAVVVAERNAITANVRRRYRTVAVAAVGKSLGDYLALYACLLAAGVRPHPIVVLAVLATANIAGAIPITPGGLGFVEAGMTGALAIAGVGRIDALEAVAAYRVASMWLPVAAGAVAAGAFRVRQRRVGSADESFADLSV